MSGAVHNPNEISLFGKKFPISGGVRETVVTPLAPKFVLGDYSRDDKVVDSSWVLDDFSGGLGILQHSFPRDQDRFWFSRDVSTMYRYLTLGQRRVDVATLDGITKLVPYNDKLFVVANNEVYPWDENTQTLGVSVQSLDGPVTAHTVYAGNLIISTEVALYEYDGTNWTVYDGSVTSYQPGGYAMTVWDGKLFVLGIDNTMRWTIDPSDTDTDWTDGGTLHLPPGYCRQLIPYFDQAGEMAIHGITRVGVFAYDHAAETWYDTPLVFPDTREAGTGAIVWRGVLHVPAGQYIYTYNGSVIRNQSVGSEDGLPSAYRGSIVKLVGGHGHWYAVMQRESAAEETEQETNIDDPFDLPFMTGTESTAAVFASPEQSWHVLTALPVGVGISDVVVATVEGTFRLWIATTEGISYYDLSRSLHNPLQNPAAEFQPEGYLETGWSDMGWAELDKLAVQVDVEARDVDDDHTIDVYAAWDEAETWEHVGTVTRAGQTTFDLGGRYGRVFRSVRLRVEMKRGDDVTRTPVMRSLVLTFHRIPEQMFGYQFDLQMTGNYNGRTPRQMVRELKEIIREKRAGDFIYLDEEGDLERKVVRISRVTGTSMTGRARKSRWTVSVLEIGG